MQFEDSRAMRPTARTWAKHTVFFLITLCTATMAGVFFPFGGNTSPLFQIENYFDSLPHLLLIPYLIPYFCLQGLHYTFSNPEILKQGLSFSLPLLFILTAHEFGHYIACRLYRVDATLPYFLPVPLLSPAGTFGAFIKILSPLPSRRATFDIGVAGPIAGFVAIIPVLAIAFLTMSNSIPEKAASEADLVFAHSLLAKFFAFVFNADLNLVKPNGFYFAAWVGLLITSLNLIPAGQLDGGHAVYAVFGERFHKLTGKAAFAVMICITLTGWFVFSSPSGLLFTVLLGVMLRIRHPEPIDDSPLGFKRNVIAVITLIIFVLSFMPFPIRIP